MKVVETVPLGEGGVVNLYRQASGHLDFSQRRTVTLSNKSMWQSGSTGGEKIMALQTQGENEPKEELCGPEIPADIDPGSKALVEYP